MQLQYIARTEHNIWKNNVTTKTKKLNHCGLLTLNSILYRSNDKIALLVIANNDFVNYLQHKWLDGKSSNVRELNRHEHQNVKIGMAFFLSFVIE